MKLFYGEINKTEVIIHKDEQQHITKVLRMKEGEEIFITNGKGSLAKGTLIYEGKKILFHTLEIKENIPDFSPKFCGKSHRNGNFRNYFSFNR